MRQQTAEQFPMEGIDLWTMPTSDAIRAPYTTPSRKASKAIAVPLASVRRGFNLSKGTTKVRDNIRYSTRAILVDKNAS
eukprot:scaffold2510_cov169-Amphora_coffeaeformis.AAC.23